MEKVKVNNFDKELKIIKTKLKEMDELDAAKLIVHLLSEHTETEKILKICIEFIK